jgi:hypothetical protein
MERGKKDVVLIVDPFSTGALFAPRFKARGYRCYAVLSAPTVPERFTKAFTGEGFEQHELIGTAEIVSLFKPAQVSAVVAGSELGVRVADQLARHFGVSGNAPETSAWRRDKYAMQQAIANAGLRHIPSIEVASEAEGKRALEQLPEHGGFVLKPVNSFMTDGVALVEGRAGLEHAMSCLAWSGTNALGEPNSRYLIQGFVTGPEYVVDMVVSADGVQVSSLCRYRKAEHHGARFVYEGLEVLDPLNDRFTALVAYARNCALALDVRFGPLHMELIDGPEGPVMIEAGARLHGGVAPSLFTLCYEPDLLSVAVSTYLHEPVTYPVVSRLKKQGRIVFLITPQEGVCLDIGEPAHRQLQAIEAFKGIKRFADADQRLPLTRDLATCPGIVWLAANDLAELDQAEVHVRQILEPCFHD